MAYSNKGPQGDGGDQPMPSNAAPKTSPKPVSKPKSAFEKFRDSISGPQTEKQKAASAAFHESFSNNKSEGAADQNAASVAEPEDMTKTYSDNLKRYNDYMAQQKEDAATKARMGRATSMYERQNRGAGPVPRQMQGLNQFRNPYMPPMRGGQPVEYRQRQQTGETQPFERQGIGGNGYNMGRVNTDSLPSRMAPGTGGSGVPRGLNTPPSMQGNENQRSVGAILQQDGSIDNTAMMQQRRGYQPAVMPPYNGVMPIPQRRPQNQATSPAFRYAGQNYDRLGGQQRMYDRPMEAMSQRERQGVRDVRDDMDRFRPMPLPGSEYRQQGGQQGQQGQQQGIASLLQNMMSNKGGGRTAPQPQMSRYQTMRPQSFRGGSPTQSFGGKGSGQTMPQQSNFGRMLAARFGGGNQGGGGGFGF
mgnify:CR=1 FL=1